MRCQFKLIFLFSQILFSSDYVPRLEVLAARLVYDNETAVLKVYIHVGVPKNLPNQLRSSGIDRDDQQENFTNYEIYLTAMADDESSTLPTSCASDAFLQHSFVDVAVGCSSPGSSSHSPTSVQEVNLPGNTTGAVRDLEKTCIDAGTVVTRIAVDRGRGRPYMKRSH